MKEDELYKQHKVLNFVWTERHHKVFNIFYDHIGPSNKNKRKNPLPKRHRWQLLFFCPTYIFMMIWS